MSATNAEVNHGAVVNDAVVNNEMSVISGHSPSLGSVGRVSPEPQIPGDQRPENATASNESLLQRVVSRVTETGNNLRESVDSAVGMTSRGMQMFSMLVQAYYYRASPEAVAKILSLAGIYGKLAQYLVARMDEFQHLLTGSDQQVAGFIGDLMRVVSQYPAGELNSDYVLDLLDEQIANSGYLDEMWANGVDISHVNTVGRGTICQLDRVDINGIDYVVKTVSPSLSRSIGGDVDLLTKCIIPAMGLMRHFSKSDVEVFSNAVKTFGQETDLSRELVNTEKQAAVLKRLSETKAYSIKVSVGDQTCQVPLKFKAPEVNETLSNSNILVMEFIDGCSLDRLEEVSERLRLWRPDWNNCEQLSEVQIKSIINSLYQQVLTVYLEAWQQSGFLNVDFQPGNFMMKLEGGGITVNFIDHGNCVVLKDFMGAINNVINYSLLHGLFVFFHNRCHGKNQAEENQSPSASDTLLVPSRIRDLTCIPLSCRDVERIKLLVSDYQRVFRETIIPSMDDFLNEYQREQTVEQVCLQLFNWLQSSWVLMNEDNDESRRALQRDAFVNDLPVLLYRLAIGNENFNLEDESQLRRKIDFAFDDIVRDMGFHMRLEDILLIRVKAQIEAFRMLVLEAVLGES
ncbi:AarF/UbiB family protein [Endozoicomonas sp. YOMI1]|uniref:AarF/UbiB family protein n=1 Tax=Endozoicomonas sp. YOMI1 TaxID=2828739 RepID=UPI0021489640